MDRGTLALFDYISQDTKHSIMPIVIPVKLSGYPAAIQHMNQGLSFATVWRGICVLLSPEVQVGIMRQGMHRSIEGESH